MGLAIPAKIQARKVRLAAYLAPMTAEALLKENIRYDRGGKPIEIVIPYEEFIDFI